MKYSWVAVDLLGVNISRTISYLGSFSSMTEESKACVTSVRISQDMIKPYTGEGDLISWLKKVQLVAKLAKVTDLASFLPLYLEGDALAVYLEMSEDDQKSAKEIEDRLKTAFTDGSFIAYGKLTRCKWDGEPVDVYATEIRRLVGLSGLTGAGAETLVRLAFVNGMPENIRVELMQVEDIEEAEMSDVIARARVLVGVKAESGVSAVASGRGSVSRPSVKPKYSGNKSENRSDSTDGGKQSGFKGKCFKCDGPHMARNCPDRKISCFKCGVDGHMSYNCQSGN